MTTVAYGYAFDGDSMDTIIDVRKTDYETSLYAFLRIERREIRLLVLLPGQHHEQIKCRMRTMSLDFPIDYEALSYVWGGTFDDRDDIVINDIECDVGHNLGQALRHLRLPDTLRTLWVDALCINQQDIAERTFQVQMMGEIYRTASRTVVWLGTFAKPGRLAMDLIHRIATEGTSAAFQAGSELARQSLRLVLQCPWWQRAWIIQELALSRGEPLLYCGTTSLPWSEFVAFWDLTTSTKMQETSDPREVSKWQEFAAHIAPLRLIRDWPAEQRTWARLLLLTSHYLASDPRDRIFALHGLFTSEIQKSWLPSYEQDVRETYTAFTRFMIESHGLNILCFDKPRTQKDLPSWVPDYSSTCSLVNAGGHEFLPEEIAYPAENPPSGFRFLKKGQMLCVKVTEIAKVRHVVRPGQEIGMKSVFLQSRQIFNHGRPSYHDLTQNIERWDEVSAYGEERIAERRRLLGFDSICSLAEILGCRKPGYLPEYTSLFDELMDVRRPWNLDFIPQDGAQLGQDEQRFLPMLDFMFQAVKRHCFFSTDNDLYGMGHSDMRSGDEIVLAAGCHMPLLLRESTTHHSYSHFVGSCEIPSLSKSKQGFGYVRDCTIE